jgi:hypothetical protein
LLRTPRRSRSGSDEDATLTHQIYVTHCLHGEGVFRQAGFNVRACSTRDPLLLRFALDYPAHEVPLGVAAAELSPAAAPRRLALVRIPGGRAALVHSAYLPDGGRGRANNFFAHVLVRPALTPREALAAWASPDWVTGCDPGVGQDLPPLPGLPRPGPVSDEAVTSFLQAQVRAEDRDVATLTCPPRLASAPRRRRELLALALRGCLRVLQAGPADPRGRLYILAEPGLTALLLYAAARLLPESLTAKLTFSTYENAHRDLRTYRHAQVVGTYTADPARGLEQEYFTTRGYALDTFNNTSSPELAADEEAPVEEWIDLAARGDWATVDKAHRLLAHRNGSVVSLREGVQTARFLRRLAAGQVEAADLLALRRSSWGPALLEEQRARVWPLVRDGSLASARLRDEFADLLRDHLPELEQRAQEVLRADPAENWRPHWRLLCSVLKEDPVRLRDALQRVLPEPPYPAALRFALLQELHHLQLSPLDQRLPFHGLLRGCTAEELDELSRSDLPREWFVWALCYALLKQEPRAGAVRHLHGGNDALVRTFWEQLRLLKDEDQRRAVLAPLFPTAGPEGAAFLGRLLQHRSVLRPETLEWLLDWLGAWKEEWAEFWARDNHRGQLFDILRECGAEAGGLWDRFCGRINQHLLLPGDPAQTALLIDLAAVRDRPGALLPPRADQTIADWVLLRDHFEKAAAVPDDARQAVIEACNRRGLDAIGTLARYFERFVRPRGMNREVLDDFARFFHSFYPGGTEYQDHSSRLVGWLQVVGGCADENLRAAYQRYYLERFVPTEFRARLAEEHHRAGKLLSAAYEALPAPVAAPAPVMASAALPEEPTGEPFHLTGVRPTEPGRVWSILERFPWLLSGAVGGTVAAVLCGLNAAQLKRTAALVLFVPLVVTLAESMALQGVAVGASGLRRKRPRSFGMELLVGIGLALGCGLVVAAGAAAWFGPVRLAWCVGGTVASGMAAAAVVGLAVPALVGLLRLEGRVAAGPLARAAAGVLALLVYFSLARWLLG